uniref:Uncharacterized protein n=1 Tax=Compsopogon caeruleus TaxID=31354 RepID=A0A7S1T638_9RHOD
MYSECAHRHGRNQAHVPTVRHPYSYVICIRAFVLTTRSMHHYRTVTSHDQSRWKNPKSHFGIRLHFSATIQSIDLPFLSPERERGNSHGLSTESTLRRSSE